MASDHSRNLRAQGNDLYKQGIDERLSPIARSSRLLKASSLYTQALAASRTEDDRAKCSKNLGVVHWNHAKMSLELYNDGHASSLLHERPPAFDIENSVKNYLAALRHGRASHQPQQWIGSIEETLEQMASTLLEEHAWIAEAVFLQKLCDLYQTGLPPGAKSKAYDVLQLGQVQVTFDEAMRELHRKEETNPPGANYSKCLALVDRCSVPMEQVQRRAKCDSETLEKVRALKSSIENCRAICESIKAREEGKRHMQDYRKPRDEDSRQYYLTCALDKFKEAVGHAKGVDAECEAEALACAGDAYTEIKKEDKAQSYYTAVVKIAQNSDMLQKKSYYERAKAAANAWLKRMREGRPAFNMLPEIKPDLDRIETEFKRLPTDQFLIFVYKFYPPRAREGIYTLGEVGDPTQMRIALRKALHHYHPDHNALGDDKWVALCGEITKLLLQRHQAAAQ